MSPLSIAQALDFMSKKAGYVNGELTIVDINPASYESAKETLERIASRSGIKINFFRENIKKIRPDKNSYGAVIADQVFNFIDPREWSETTENLLELIDQNGYFINIIALFRKGIKLGEEAWSELTKIAQQKEGRIESLRPKIQYLYTHFTGLFNEQVAAIIPGKAKKQQTNQED